MNQDDDHDDGCLEAWAATPTAGTPMGTDRQDVVPLSLCRHGIWRHVPEVPADDGP